MACSWEIKVVLDWDTLLDLKLQKVLCWDRVRIQASVYECASLKNKPEDVLLHPNVNYDFRFVKKKNITLWLVSWNSALSVQFILCSTGRQRRYLAQHWTILNPFFAFLPAFKTTLVIITGEWIKTDISNYP